MQVYIIVQLVPSAVVVVVAAAVVVVVVVVVHSNSYPSMICISVHL